VVSEESERGTEFREFPRSEEIMGKQSKTVHLGSLLFTGTAGDQKKSI